MTYDYNTENRVPVRLVLEGGSSLTGEFLDVRVTVDTLPAGQQWYQVRHFDDDWSRPASLKYGCVAVNFLGTVICKPIKGLSPGDEATILSFERQ